MPGIKPESAAHKAYASNLDYLSSHHNVIFKQLGCLLGREMMISLPHAKATLQTQTCKPFAASPQETLINIYVSPKPGIDLST